MKKRIPYIALALLMFVVAGCTAQTPQANEPTASASQPGATSSLVDDDGDPAQAMTVTSAGITGGVIDPTYGMHGVQVVQGVPTLSLPLEIANVPKNTVCFAVYMEDLSTEPAWVHWMAVNVMQSVIPEDFSLTADDSVIQGTNDFNTIGYGGPTPPKDHTYAVTVYALDARLDLDSGFTLEQFRAALEGHIIAECTLEGNYKTDK